jgi:hypothetical protein
VTFSSSGGGGFLTGVVEEITPSTLDKHSLLANQSVSAGGALTTTSVTTSAADYAFSYAVDAMASGGAPTVSSPFTGHDVHYVYGEADGDYTQLASGVITASWTFGNATPGATVGMMTFK